MKFQNKAEYFVLCPVAWLLHGGFKRGVVNTHMGYYILKKLDPEAVDMVVES